MNRWHPASQPLPTAADLQRLAEEAPPPHTPPVFDPDEEDWWGWEDLYGHYDD